MFRKSKRNKFSVAAANNAAGQMDVLTGAIKKTLKKGDIEPAFQNINHQVGALHIWRINQLKLEAVLPPEYGYFYDGDSYLILKVKENEHGEVVYNIFIWIGKYSTIDEYTTVAIKAAELDKTILNGSANQFRETQGNETDEFLELFPEFTILKGGYDRVANKRTNDTSAAPSIKRLLHVSGVRKTVKIVEVSYRFENLNSDDVFILQNGDKVYQLNGKDSNLAEKTMAMDAIGQMKTDNSKLTVEVIDGEEKGFQHAVIDEMPRKHKATLQRLKKPQQKPAVEPSLYKLSDESGQIEFTLIGQGPFTKSSLNGSDVFLFDNNDVCYIWIGKDASDDEKNLSVIYGHAYLQKKNRLDTPTRVIHQDREMILFWKRFLSKK